MINISTNLKKRIISALVLFVPLLYIVLHGGAILYVFISLLGIIISWEWFRITLKKEFHFPLVVMSICALITVYYSYQNNFIAILILILACIVSLQITSNVKSLTKWHVIGSVYILVSLYAITQVFVSYGQTIFLIMLFTTWVIDIGAYFTGKNFGKRKLAPSISPNKTYEGLWGAMIFASIFLVLIKTFFINIFGTIDTIQIIILAISSALIGQAGDLFESFVKRKFEVKDSSNLIPGHGGVLDRIDGLIFISILWLFFFKHIALM